MKGTTVRGQSAHGVGSIEVRVQFVDERDSLTLITGWGRTETQPARRFARYALITESIVRVCEHPPHRVYAWTARDDTAASGEVQCAACCDCGQVLAGGVS